MAIKTKLSLAVFLFFLLALCANLALGTEEPEVDPELETCKHLCRQQQQYSKSDKQKCMQSCDEYHQMKQEREREIEEETRRRKEQEMEEKGKHHHREEHEESREGEEEEEEEEEENPYVFEDEDFETRFETEDGRVRVLPKFSSKLLRGIENYRLAILEAKEHTFVSPCHFDSEAVFLVVKGRATIGLVKEDKTERFNLEPGDVIRVPAGTPVYVVNRDENEKLLLAKFHIPVSTPANFEAFYGPGGRDPESVLTAFSWDILEAALKTPRQKLERLFEQQEKGSIFKISKDDVKALSKVKGGIWPFGGRSGGPFNLFNKQPFISNQYGRLSQVDPEDEKSALGDLNLMLSYANISKGSMTAPLYVTKATKIGLVIDGEGHFEMACPHVSSSSKSRRGRSYSRGQKSSPSYHRFSSPLRPGWVFVVPSGHPFWVGASKKKNLQIVCFEVNARGNKMLTFAGKNNIVNALDKEAKELAFNCPAEKVDEIFYREEHFFLPGPGNLEEREERGRAYA